MDDVKALTDQQIIEAGDLDDATAHARLGRMLTAKIREVSARRDMAAVVRTDVMAGADEAPRHERIADKAEVDGLALSAAMVALATPRRPIGPRGPSGEQEMDDFLPDWRERSSEVATLAAQLEALMQKVTAAQSEVTALREALTKARGYVRERADRGNGPGEVAAFLAAVDALLGGQP